MGIDLSLAGKQTDPIETSYTWKDCVLYALGVGARLPGELDYLFEMNGPKVLPTFAVVPSLQCLLDIVRRLGAAPTQILHGEQKVILHRPIPPGGTFVTVAEVTGIYDKQKGALVVVEARTRDQKNEPVFDNVFSLFVRGAGGFGGERGPEALAADPPEGEEPAFTVTEKTTTEQAALYRLSGDLNPLHISPQVAQMGGFVAPILHGLCTYGHAGRAVLQHACGGNPAAFKSFAGRFTGVVFPGDELTTRAWQAGPGRYLVQVNTQSGVPVLRNAVAEVAVG